MSILGWALSALGLSGVGLGALAFFMGPAALLPILRGIFGFIAKIPWQVWLLLALAAAFAYLIHDRNKWKDKAAEYNTEALADWGAVQTASGNLRLERRDTAAQILALGQSLKATESALAKQNAAIQALADKSKAEQAQAAQASQASQERVSEAEAVVARLRASARAGAAPAGSCEPSDTLKQQWSS